MIPGDFIVTIRGNLGIYLGKNDHGMLLILKNGRIHVAFQQQDKFLLAAYRSDWKEFKEYWATEWEG